MRVEKVGLLGGTFNPIHFGHLQLATMAMREYRLDRVIFLPSAQPPHKNVTPLASFADRLAMVQLAIAGDAGVDSSALERGLPAPSYTIETLRAMARCSEGLRLFFLIGSDALMDLLSWREYDEILRRVSLIVAKRQDQKGTEVDRFLEKLGYHLVQGSWQRSGGYWPILILQGVPNHYSSTSIRECIASGGEPHGETPEAVLTYIREHCLYRADSTSDNCLHPGLSRTL